jgi:hypothetical protein
VPKTAREVCGKKRTLIPRSLWKKTDFNPERFEENSEKISRYVVMYIFIFYPEKKLDFFVYSKKSFVALFILSGTGKVQSLKLLINILCID